MLLVEEKKTYSVIETWQDFSQCLSDIHKYLDELASSDIKLRLAVDTETFICKEARDRYDILYSLTKIKKRDKDVKYWVAQVKQTIDNKASAAEALAIPKPSEFEFKIVQDPEGYPIPRPIKNRWGFFDARVRLIQIGLNPQFVNHQFVIDVEKLYDSYDGSMAEIRDIFDFYELLGDYLGPLLNRAWIIGQNLKYEYGFFWKFFKFRLEKMRDVYLMSQILYMGDKVNHKLSSLYALYIPKDKFAALIGYEPEEVESLDEEGNVVIETIDDPHGWYDRFKEEEQKSPWYQWNLMPKQHLYSSEDVGPTIWYVFEELLVRLSEWATKYDSGEPGTGVLEIVKLECELIKAIAKAEIVGFQLDLDYYYNELKPQLLKEIEDAQAECDSMYKRVIVEQKKRTTGTKKDKVIEHYEETREESYNLNSPVQVRKLLGPDICKLLPKTKKGADSTGADELFIIRDKHPVIPLILKVKQALKSISFFEGERGYLNHIDSDGVIHHTIHQIGRSEATIDTGRMAGAKPNLMQVDSDKRMRKAFIARLENEYGPKLQLIIYDLSQIEPRLQGEDAQDIFLMDCFNSGRDLHSETAKNIFHLDFLPDKNKPEDKPWRDRGKEIRLARTYLMGIDKGIKKVYVESKGKLDYLLRGEEGREAFMEDLDKFDNLTPQLKELKQQVEVDMRQLPAMYKSLAPFKDGRPFFVAKSMMGRTRRFCLLPEERADAAKYPEDWGMNVQVLYKKTGNISSWANKYNSKIREAARAAGNNRYQSSAADIFKLGIVNINKELENIADQGIIDEYSTAMINFVHDEIITQSEEGAASMVAEIVKNGMKSAAERFLKTIPVIVDGGPVATWASKN